MSDFVYALEQLKEDGPAVQVAFAEVAFAEADRLMENPDVKITGYADQPWALPLCWALLGVITEQFRQDAEEVDGAAAEMLTEGCVVISEDVLPSLAELLDEHNIQLPLEVSELLEEDQGEDSYPGHEYLMDALAKKMAERAGIEPAEDEDDGDEDREGWEDPDEAELDFGEEDTY